MKYILKDGSEIEDMPIGKAKITIGEKNNNGMLTTVGRAYCPDLTQRYAKLIYQCQCGNYGVCRTGFSFKRLQSCGCLATKMRKENCKKIGQQTHYKDYSKINNPFYIFVKPLNEYIEDGSRYWIIECKKCGRQYKEIPAFLVSEKRKKGNNPCSCWQRQSKGVILIRNLLEQNHISYQEEYTFNTCLSPKNQLMKFDFYVNKQYLIEYDGEQHFLPMTFGDQHQTGEEHLQLQQTYDSIKTQWCLQNNIPLIRIPYTHYKELCIQDLLLETSNFIMTGDNNE